MNYSEFLKSIPKLKKEILPGLDAHIKMAPLERISSLQSSNYPENLRKAAVMMLFYPRDDKTFLALILRNSYKGVHSSQIAFPGGKVEIDDKDLAETALRETFEEIGIHPNQIEIIRQFTQVYIPPSSFLVTPFLGFSSSEIIFNPSEREVAGMIEVPLEALLNDENVTNVSLETSYASKITVPCFQFGDYQVWGATAMMMSELKEVIKSAINQ